MAAKQVIGSGGFGIPFSCANYRFETDISRGARHGASTTVGSVFDSPLFTGSFGLSLWLEHVIDKQDVLNKDLLWLMWYDQAGVPMIPVSGVFDKMGLKEMVRKLVDFIP